MSAGRPLQLLFEFFQIALSLMSGLAVLSDDLVCQRKKLPSGLVPPASAGTPLRPTRSIKHEKNKYSKWVPGPQHRADAAHSAAVAPGDYAVMIRDTMTRPLTSFNHYMATPRGRGPAQPHELRGNLANKYAASASACSHETPALELLQRVRNSYQLSILPGIEFYWGYIGVV